MKKLFLIATISTLLMSCAKEELQAPCPHYGKQCYKQPVNGWGYQAEGK